MSKKHSDKQIGGEHYKRMKIQPTEFIVANDIPFIEGNVIKYVCRHNHKNGIEDIQKAIHYLNLLIEYHYEGNKVREDRSARGETRGDDADSCGFDAYQEGGICNHD